MKYTFSCLFSLFFCSFLSAQVFVYELTDEIESVINESVECLKVNPDSCRTFFDEAIELAEKENKDSLLAMAYFEVCTAIDYYGKEEDRIEYARRGVKLDGRKHPTVTNRLYRELGSAYKKIGALDSILPAYDNAMKWAKLSKDNSVIAITYIQWSGGLRRLNNLKKAIEVLLEGEPYAKASGDPHRLSGILFSLASAYDANEDTEEAIEKYDEAMKGFLEVEDSIMYMSTVVNRALASIDLGETEYAIENLPMATRYFEEKDPNSAIYPKSQYGRALTEKGEYKQAIPVLEEVLAKCKEVDNTYIALLSQKLLSKCHLNLGNHALGLTYAQNAYEVEKENGISDGFLSAIEQYAFALKVNGKTEDAINVYEELLIVKDSVEEQSKIKEIAGLQEYYEAEQRENQIILLQNEVELGKLQRALFIVGILALCAIIALLYLQFRERTKRAQLEQAKLNEELAFKKKELTTHALHLAKKNEVLTNLKEKMREYSEEEKPPAYRNLIRTIDMDLKDENNWRQFIQHFEQVHTDFNKNIQERFPNVTANELRLLALLKMNLSSKEIANLLNITPGAIKKARHRLRKKLNLNSEDSLEKMIFEM